jgi:hypothetical protein
MKNDKPIPKVTKEKVMEVLSKVFSLDKVNITYKDLRNKVLDGYAYTIKSQRGKLMTGEGGILNYLDESEKQEIDPWMAGNLITIEGKTLNEIKIINKNMNIENKYYIPEIEDFRVGFKFEEFEEDYSYTVEKLKDNPEGGVDMKITSEPKVVRSWFKKTFDLGDIDHTNVILNLEFNRIRIPYLTKEDIVSEGWSLTKEPNEIEFTCQKIISDKYFYEVDYDTYLKELTVESFYQSKLGGNPGLYNSYTIYKGTCRCINDFRLIMKLLNIKIKI